MQEQNKRYSYKPFIRQVYWIAFWVLIVAEFVVLRSHIHEILQAEWVDAIVTGVLASTVVFSIFFRLFFHVRPRVFSEYEILTDEVLIWQGKKCKRFKFSQVEKIRKTFLAPEYGGGISIKLNTGQKLMFSTLLNGFDLFVSGFQNNTDNLMAEKSYAKLHEQSEYLPFVWEYMQFKFKKWPVGLGKWLVVPSVLALIKYQTLEAVETPLWLYVCLLVFGAGLLGFAINFFEQKIIVAWARSKKWQHLPIKFCQNSFIISSVLHILLMLILITQI